MKNTCTASIETKGFCFYKFTNGREFWGRFSVPKSLIIKRHLAVDTLGLPFFRHCTSANVSDDQGLIEMLIDHLDYFRKKPVNIPKITILLDHGYHPGQNHGCITVGLSTNHDENSLSTGFEADQS